MSSPNAELKVTYHHTTEQRVCLALLVGSATAAELAKALSVDVFSVSRSLRDLQRGQMVHITGTTVSRWPSSKGKPHFTHALTPAGRQWAEEMMK